MKISVPKGTKDILPEEMKSWRYIEELFTDVCMNAGYGEIRTPVFEYTNLFNRGVGETTDIVQKEMYTFEDKGGRSLTLRPEGTAGIVRSYIENGMASLPQPVKLFYKITAYRYENVQKGRFREFNQLGAEVLGADSSNADVELISLLGNFFTKLGIGDLKLEINSIGCNICRPAYNEILKEYYKDKIDGMCADCKRRYETNPLRLIDCKEAKCIAASKDVPFIADNLCENCSDHFASLRTGLERLDINYNINKQIVRGLDYYKKTVFEFISNNVGTQGTVCGGGRYDGLIGALGGSDVSGVGFSMGTERLLMELESRGSLPGNEVYPEIYFVTIGEKSYAYARKISYALRKADIYTEMDLLGRSVKAQMKDANRKKAKYVVVMGEEEISMNKAEILVMETGERKEVSLDSIYKRIIEKKV
ncbi:MAG: histidine--tRNA ligase [Clostridia bacterium]|nr:histidine--tRNA ligase [Clostridia bacterium]MBN2883171.1 histidine--tRNA ligase [Clostridia bacterium]